MLIIDIWNSTLNHNSCLHPSFGTAIWDNSHPSNLRHVSSTFHLRPKKHFVIRNMNGYLSLALESTDPSHWFSNNYVRWLSQAEPHWKAEFKSKLGFDDHISMAWIITRREASQTMQPVTLFFFFLLSSNARYHFIGSGSASSAYGSANWHLRLSFCYCVLVIILR